MSFKRFEIEDIVDSLDPIVGTTPLTPPTGVDGNISGSAEEQAIYSAYRNLIYPYEPDTFDDEFGSTGFTAYAFDRSEYKERIDPNTSEIGGDLIKDFTTLEHTESGRLYIDGNYWALPDIGVILIKNTTQSLPGDTNIYSKETLGVKYFFIRGKNTEFNYTQNPTFLDSNGDIQQDFIYSPTTYVTTVGLYNDMNELLAVAKLSQPLPKDFNNEFLIRAKLGF